ncbi:MAG: SigB/SigF/SigG family RNA polymerase sigma factor [Clostridia bacterium]|nr:SigB/SigF/SigG family RNA polymerase sigma factor [Clostridia bacterium]
MQYNKVEISGINTGSLKVLTEAEKQELLIKAKAGDKKASDALVEGNLRLVLSVIQRFSNRGESMDDLFQVGCVGLIKAIKNFNTELDIRFSTYAVPMIEGELKRYLRDYNAIRVSRSMRDTAYKAMQTRDLLLAKNDRDPSAEQIADELGISKSEVVIAMEAVTEPISLYDPVYSDNGDTLYVMDQLGDVYGERDWIDEITLKDQIRNLSERERKIMNLRFIRGLTQTEVAKEINISQAQVSRLEKAVIAKIKGDL